MSKVAILGCGPNGLLAAHAAQLAGHEPVIFSRKVKSVIPGSQYLHSGIPGLTSQYPESHVQYVRMGTGEGYAKKVYGDAGRNTGWEHYYQVYPSWNVVNAYDKLWEEFEDEIVPVELGTLHAIKDILLEFCTIISTIPAPELCYKGHKFNGTPYWISTLPVPPADHHHDIVIYNGLLDDPWYRWSILSGVCSIEYATEPPDITWYIPAGHDKPALSFVREGTLIPGTKAHSTNCDCWLPDIQRVGRWAEWRHGVLMDDAFRKAQSLMPKGERA